MSFIVVQHYQFPIEDPFYAGYPLTPIEADVLNWHRTRLIQKIVNRWILEAIEKAGGDLLSVEEVKEMADRVREFDLQYELLPVKPPKPALLEYHLTMLAENFLLRNGKRLREEDVERIKKTPEIQARARELIRSSTFSLEELMV